MSTTEESVIAEITEDDNAASSTEELETETLELDGEETEEIEVEEESPEVIQTRNTQKRFDDLTGTIRDQQEEIDTLKQGNPIEFEDMEAPNRDDFDDDIEYASAQGAYLGAQRVFNTLKKNQDTARQTHAAESTQGQLNAHKQRVEQSRETIKDYDEVVAASELVVTDSTGEKLLPVAQAMLRQKNSPDIAYHIGANPEIARELNRADPVEQAVIIGRLSEQLKASPNKITKIPAPIESEDTGTGAAARSEQFPHLGKATFT